MPGKFHGGIRGDRIVVSLGDHQRMRRPVFLDDRDNLEAGLTLDARAGRVFQTAEHGRDRSHDDGPPMRIGGNGEATRMIVRAAKIKRVDDLARGEGG